MFKNFLQNNNRSILLIGIFIGVWVVLYFFNYSDKDTVNYLHNPTKGQIYIFEKDNVYAPMRLDSVSKTSLYLRNYMFTFVDAIPDRKQILSNEFDLNFYAIYQKEEMDRLYKEGNLVRIYK